MALTIGNYGGNLRKARLQCECLESSECGAYAKVQNDSSFDSRHLGIIQFHRMLGSIVDLPVCTVRRVGAS